MSALNTSSCTTLLRSLSSFLGPPNSRRNKFVGERKGESWYFEITRDPLKVVEYTASPGLLSTALGCILRQFSKESFNLGTTWTVVFTVSLYAKLRQHLLDGDQYSFSTLQVKLCVEKIGRKCLALAEELKMDLKDIEMYQFYMPGSQLEDEKSQDSIEDDTSWFFREAGVDIDVDLDGAISNQYRTEKGRIEKQKLAKFLSCLCKTLYSGGQIENVMDGGASCVTERLCQQFLMSLLTNPAEDMMEMDLILETVHVLLDDNWIQGNLDVLEVVGPGEKCSFATQGIVFPVTKMSEIIMASGSLPLNELSSELDLTRALSSNVRVILLSGNLNLSTIEIGFHRSAVKDACDIQHDNFHELLKEDKAEIVKELGAYCSEIIRKSLEVSLVLVGGSVDCHVEMELRKNGVLLVSCLGSETLFKVSKVSKSSVLANFFSIEERHIGELEVSMLRSYGGNVPSSSTYVPKLGKAHEPCDRDSYFISARPLHFLHSIGREGAVHQKPICTLVVCSRLENQCNFLVQEVKQLVNRALVCLDRGFLQGNGCFERSLIEALDKQRGDSTLPDLVIRSFVLALQEVHELSFKSCHSSIHAPLDESYVHFDSFHERHCGVKRAIEMLTTMLVTENVIINKRN